MGRRGTPNGTTPITLSLDKRVVELLNQLPSGERSKRVNEVLISNMTTLGGNLQEQADLWACYIRMKFAPILLKEVIKVLEELPRMSTSQLKDIIERSGRDD